MPVVKYRIDGRMLHGQTCTSWGPYLKVDEYIIVNEKVADTPMQVTLLEMAAMGTPVTVCSPSKAAELILSGDFEGERTMIVFKYLEDAVETMKAGVKIDELSIGGIYDEADKNKTKYDMNLFVNEAEKELLRYIDSQGTKVYIQIVPDYRPKLVKDLIKY